MIFFNHLILSINANITIRIMPIIEVADHSITEEIAPTIFIIHTFLLIDLFFPWAYKKFSIINVIIPLPIEFLVPKI